MSSPPDKTRDRSDVSPDETRKARGTLDTTPRLRPPREAAQPGASGEARGIESRGIEPRATEPDIDHSDFDRSGSSDGTGTTDVDALAAAAAEEVARARAGDRDAFRLLVERYQQKVFNWVLRTVRCDRDMAADLCQEVFLRVHRGLPTFDGRARFTTWLHTIMTNVCISEYRRRRAMKRDKWTFSLDAPLRGTDDLYLDPPSRDGDPSAKAHHREIARAVQEAVDELPHEFREAVLMRDLQGMSYEEIGELLRIPPGTVRSRIHRGRLILQQKLEEFRP